jgi:hypothetical protein
VSGECEGWLIGEFTQIFSGTIPELYDWYDKCRRSAVTFVAAGCVHEHVRRYRLCGRCAENTQRQIAAKVAANCLACLPDHKCTVVMAIEAQAVTP